MVERGNGGAVVITGSTSTFRGVAYKTAMLNPGHMAYGAAKAGVLALMRNHTMALGKYGIRVDTILPAGVDTPMVADQVLHERPPGRSASRLDGQRHGARPGESGDISDGVLFLLSDEAKYVTGTALPVDMGLLRPGGGEGTLTMRHGADGLRRGSRRSDEENEKTGG